MKKYDADGNLVFEQASCNPKFVSNGQRFWCFFESDGKRYFFKDENAVTNNAYEILAGYIANAVGLNAVKYQPAVFVGIDGKKTSGVVSEDYTNGGQYLKFNSQSLGGYSDSDENTVENHMIQLENFLADAKNKFGGQILFDKRKMQNDLYNMMIFDTFLLNTDRARRNIEYLLKKVDVNTWKVELAPIYDNSQVFGMSSLENRMKILKCIEDDVDIPKEVYEGTDFLFGTKNCMKFEQLVDKISALSTLNPYIKVTVEKFKNLDFEKLYNDIKNENPNLKMPQEILCLASKIIDGSVKKNLAFQKRKFCFEF